MGTADGRTPLPSETELRFNDSARKTKKRSDRLALYRKATAVGEFFELHQGTAGDAAQDLRNDLTRTPPLCITPGFAPPKDLRIAPPGPP